MNNETTITPEQIRAAAQVGLDILSAPTTMVPASSVDALPMLKLMLRGIALGQLALFQPEAAQPQPTPEDASPAPIVNRKQRRAERKPTAKPTS